MKICLVVPYDLAEEGGVKRHAFHLAAGLRRLGDDVTIMGASSIPQPDPGVRGFGGILNIRSNGSDNRLAILTPPWKIRRWLHEQAFEVVHVHEPLCPLLAPWASLFAGRAARVATFHAFAEQEALAPRLLRAWSGPLVLRGFARGIAVSRPAERYARYVWKRDLAIIPNGVPTATFLAGERAEPSTAAVRLLFLGHWRDGRKGLPVLLDALERLRARGVPVTLDVIGKGPTDEAPVIPGVTFHGAVASEPAIARLLHQCDVFVAPATGQESFGIVLLEAMASGCPIVCSDIEGYRQVVGEGNAWFVPAGAPDALAEAIDGLVRDPAARRAMSVRNRRDATRFDWASVVEQVRLEYLAAIAADR